MTKNTKKKYVLLLLIGVVFVLITVGCSSDYSWGWFTVSPFTPKGKSNLRFLLGGLLPTVQLSVVSFVISVGLALIIAIFTTIRVKTLNILGNTWVLIFRSIPVLVMLLWMYYGLPIVANIQISIFSAALVSMSLCESAFLAEIFRAGIEAISKSQVESARVEGATTLKVYIKIILPQVFAKMLPALINQLVYMLKISSLASVIGFSELTRKANELTVVEYRPLEIYTILIIEYLVLILLVTLLERWIAKRLDATHAD